MNAWGDVRARTDRVDPEMEGDLPVAIVFRNIQRYCDAWPSLTAPRSDENPYTRRRGRSPVD